VSVKLNYSTFFYFFLQDGEDKSSIHENWKNIFEILELCGKILKWQPFLKYNKNWSKDIYWQKLIEIVSSTSPRPSENKQILFVATLLFVLSLQQYIKATNLRRSQNNETDCCLLLVELKGG
jgi:integrator complex subunit 10